ncbi:MAG: Toluene tolerance protein Ttg2D [uncultured bacterium]|nr:MAG: Toluene tolerance protein Ttg2D [uncultured bacterium]
MQIRKPWNLFFIMTAIFLACMPILTKAASQSDPVALLQSIADNMVSQLRANKATLKTKPQIVYRLAYRYVVPYADLPEMSRRVLPPQVWNKATSSQRIQFQKEFTTLLIRTYASALTSYKDQVVQFFPVRGGSQGMKTVEVNSEIVSSESQPIRVTYRLIRVGSVWRLYDMSVEGVSLIESFRSQFADILSTGDMNKLINQLARHNSGRG